MAIRFIKVRNKREWVCDICRKCGDPNCCSDNSAKWIKRLELTTNAERDALDKATSGGGSGAYEGLRLTDYGGEFALCNNCFAEWSKKTEHEIANNIGVIKGKI